ncbi:hypothetical protein P7C73_g1332, partial [Tremellales sp. Uapishka_1]
MAFLKAVWSVITGVGTAFDFSKTNIEVPVNPNVEVLPEASANQIVNGPTGTQAVNVVDREAEHVGNIAERAVGKASDNLTVATRAGANATTQVAEGARGGIETVSQGAAWGSGLLGAGGWLAGLGGALAGWGLRQRQQAEGDARLREAQAVQERARGQNARDNQNQQMRHQRERIDLAERQRQQHIQAVADTPRVEGQKETAYRVICEEGSRLLHMTLRKLLGTRNRLPNLAVYVQVVVDSDGLLTPAYDMIYSEPDGFLAQTVEEENGRLGCAVIRERDLGQVVMELTDHYRFQSSIISTRRAAFLRLGLSYPADVSFAMWDDTLNPEQREHASNIANSTEAVQGIHTVILVLSAEQGGSSRRAPFKLFSSSKKLLGQELAGCTIARDISDLPDERRRRPGRILLGPALHIIGLEHNGVPDVTILRDRFPFADFLGTVETEGVVQSRLSRIVVWSHSEEDAQERAFGSKPFVRIDTARWFDGIAFVSIPGGPRTYADGSPVPDEDVVAPGLRALAPAEPQTNTPPDSLG